MKPAHIAIAIGSVATAVEALEDILVEKGVLKPDELMERLKTLAEKKALTDTAGDGD